MSIKPAVTPGKQAPRVEGLEEVVTHMRSVKEMQDKLAAAMSALRQQLLAEAGKVRSKHEAAGIPCPRVDVVAGDGTTVPVSWPSKFKPISSEHVPQLEQEMGDLFPLAFRVTHRVGLKKHATLEMLQSLAGKKWKRIAGLFDVRAQVEPVPDFDDVKAQLRVTNPKLVLLLNQVEDLRDSAKVRLA